MYNVTFAIALFVICLLFVLPPLDLQMGHLMLPFGMPLEVCCTVCDVVTVLAV